MHGETLKFITYLNTVTCFSLVQSS